MIDADQSVFPSNIVKLVADRVPSIDSELSVFRRPLRSSDPNQSVGVFPAMWVPNENSQEIGRTNPGEPTIQTYHVTIQAFVKDGDEVTGLERHSALSYMVRSMLYRDPMLRVGFPALAFTYQGVTERVRLWGVRGQRFISNEVTGSWLYLSTLDVWAETMSN